MSARLSPKAMAAAGWTRTDGTKGKLHAVWKHAAGWCLQHCGHPTALYPWLLISPAGGWVLTGVRGPFRRADYGQAWENLAVAVAFVASPEAAAFAGWTETR